MNIYITILLQFLLISSSILILFKLRTKIGLAPLYILLGTVQYLQALSGKMISFDVLGNMPIYPGSVILFSAVLFAVLLIYIKEGAVSARALIIGIIISNFILSALFGISYVQEYQTQIISVEDSASVFQINYKYFITGTLILLVDFIFLVILYQFLISKIKKHYFFLVLFISLVTILIFDALVFNLILKYDSPVFKASLLGHIIGKSISALTFSTILYIYLKFIDVDKNNSSFIASKDRDIFSILSFRKKYLDLKVEKIQVEQKLTSKLESTLNNISDGFISLDTNWCYTYVNIKAGEFLGRTPESLVGKHIWTEFPEGIDLPFYKAYYKAVKTQQTQYFEEFYEPFDKWFENRIYPSPDGLTIYFTDITEKRKAEADNQTLLSLIETDDDFIGVSTLKGKPVYLNRSGRELVGLEKDAEMPESILGFFPDVYQETIANVHMPQIMQHGKWNGEAQFRNLKTDAIIPIEMSGFLIRDPITNEPIALGNVARDITERKKAKEQIVKSEQQFRSLTSNAPVAIFQTDNEGSCDFVNEEWIKYAGMPFNDAMGFGWANAIHPDDKERVLNDWKQAIVSKEEFVSEFRFKDEKGKITWLSAKAEGLYDAQNNLYGYIGMALDITERKKTELELLESENHLRTILETEPECIKELNSKGELIYMNPAGLAMIEADNFEMVKGQSIMNLIMPDHQKAFKKLNSQIFKGQSGKLEFEIKGIKGTARWLETNAVPFRDTDGKIISLLGVTRDVTNRKLAEKDLLKNKKYLDNIINNIGDPVFVKDEQSSMLLANDAFCEIFNMSRTNMIGKTLAEELPLDEIEGFLRIDKQVLATGIENINEENLTVRDGETRIISTKKSRYIDESGTKYLIGVIRDITERKKTEIDLNNYKDKLEKNNKELTNLANHNQNLREEERKALAREIHDDLGQTLTALKLDLVGMKNRLDPNQKSEIENILSTIELSNYAIKTTQNITSELRPGIIDDLGLIAAIEWYTDQFYKRSNIIINLNVKIDEEDINEDCKIAIYRIIQESLTNVIRHAEATNVTITLEKLDAKIILHIKDNGIGISNEALGKSNSFGLMGMRERAHAINGEIIIEGKKNVGTTVKLYIPLKIG